MTGLLCSNIAGVQYKRDNRHTYIVFLCLPPCLCSFYFLLLLSSSVQRWQPCTRQGNSRFISRPAAQQSRHNELQRCHSASYSSSSSSPQEPRLLVSMTDCLPASVCEDVPAVLGCVKTWANEVNHLSQFQEIASF